MAFSYSFRRQYCRPECVSERLLIAFLIQAKTIRTSPHLASAIMMAPPHPMNEAIERIFHTITMRSIPALFARCAADIHPPPKHATKKAIFHRDISHLSLGRTSATQRHDTPVRCSLVRINVRGAGWPWQCRPETSTQRSPIVHRGNTWQHPARGAPSSSPLETAWHICLAHQL